MSTNAVSLKGGGQGWQLILADLALILFLLTLSALPDAETEPLQRLADRAARSEPPRIAPARSGTAAIAAAQALYRPAAGGPDLGEWLASQPRDSRTTLTVFARHRPGGEAAAWDAARRLAAGARGSGVPVRTIITAGNEADLYASLAYDEAALN